MIKFPADFERILRSSAAAAVRQPSTSSLLAFEAGTGQLAGQFLLNLLFVKIVLTDSSNHGEANRVPAEARFCPVNKGYRLPELAKKS